MDEDAGISAVRRLLAEQERAERERPWYALLRVAGTRAAQRRVSREAFLETAGNAYDAGADEAEDAT